MYSRCVSPLPCTPSSTCARSQSGSSVEEAAHRRARGRAHLVFLLQQVRVKQDELPAAPRADACQGTDELGVVLVAQLAPVPALPAHVRDHDRRIRGQLRGDARDAQHGAAHGLPPQRTERGLDGLQRLGGHALRRGLHAPAEGRAAVLQQQALEPPGRLAVARHEHAVRPVLLVLECWLDVRDRDEMRREDCIQMDGNAA